MTKSVIIRDSGIHQNDPFFTIHSDILIKLLEINEYENIIFNETLICNYLKELYKEEEYSDGGVLHAVDELIATSPVFYEPQIFDEGIALKCKLLPFTFYNTNLLIYYDNSNPELKTLCLEIYQLLVNGSIDKNSALKAMNKIVIKNIVGEELANKFCFKEVDKWSL